MGHKERRERARRAWREGEEARRAGKKVNANPYKISEWGVGAEWRCGWLDEDERIRAQEQSDASPT